MLPKKLTKFSLAMLLIPSTCWGNDILSLNSDLNNLPIFYDILGDIPKYHDALQKAQEACFKQIGLTEQIEHITVYTTAKATNTATVAINRHTPFNADRVAAIGYAVYSVGVKKHITQKFRNPLFHSVMHTITLSENSITIGIMIPF